MSHEAIEIIRSLRSDAQLVRFASTLRAWLLADTESPAGERGSLPESRARALIRGAGALDEATTTDFQRLASSTDGMRVILYDLLAETELAGQEQVKILAANAGHWTGTNDQEVAWHSLILAAFARQRDYPLTHLNPASPPVRFSPAGQAVKQAATFARRQVRRTKAERDQIAKRLAPRDLGSGTPVEPSSGEGVIAPLPPHFRSPIPVRYPEFSRETLQVEPLEESGSQTPERGESLKITEDDLAEDTPATPMEETESAAPTRMPAIRIAADQVDETRLPSPLPSNAVLMPANSSDSRPGLAVALRQMFSSEDLLTTKLRVIAQDYPDGPGLFGLQVKISCKGIRSFVAGTTDRDGKFIAELPVKQSEGLTYDVDLTWPREMGGETERKSLTLHADRTEFNLPFYRRLEAREPVDEHSPD